MTSCQCLKVLPQQGGEAPAERLCASSKKKLSGKPPCRRSAGIVSEVQGLSVCPEAVPVSPEGKFGLGFGRAIAYSSHARWIQPMRHAITNISLSAPPCNPRRRRGLLHRIYLRGAT